MSHQLAQKQIVRFNFPLPFCRYLFLIMISVVFTLSSGCKNTNRIATTEAFKNIVAEIENKDLPFSISKDMIMARGNMDASANMRMPDSQSNVAKGADLVYRDASSRYEILRNKHFMKLMQLQKQIDNTLQNIKNNNIEYFKEFRLHNHTLAEYKDSLDNINSIADELLSKSSNIIGGWEALARLDGAEKFLLLQAPGARYQYNKNTNRLTGVFLVKKFTKMGTLSPSSKLAWVMISHQKYIEELLENNQLVVFCVPMESSTQEELDQLGAMGCPGYMTIDCTGLLESIDQAEGSRNEHGGWNTGKLESMMDKINTIWSDLGGKIPRPISTNSTNIIKIIKNPEDLKWLNPQSGPNSGTIKVINDFPTTGNKTIVMQGPNPTDGPGRIDGYKYLMISDNGVTNLKLDGNGNLLLIPGCIMMTELKASKFDDLWHSNLVIN